MLQDIMGDYTDKTVTIEKFPHYSGNIQMASIHPCKHAELMKTLFLRADNALKIRREKQRKGLVSDGPADLQSLIGDVDKLSLAHDRKGEPKGKGEDEWEVVDTDDSPDQEEAAISIDQYLVVFLKVSRYVILKRPYLLTWCNSFSRQSHRRLNLTIRWPFERTLKTQNNSTKAAYILHHSSRLYHLKCDFTISLIWANPHDLNATAFSLRMKIIGRGEETVRHFCMKGTSLIRPSI
jgi:hypothetical protein